MAVDVQRLIGQHESRRSARSAFEKRWQSIAELIIPRKAWFDRRRQGNETKGETKTQRIFDAVPAIALDRFAAAVHSLVTPKNQVWHKLAPSTKKLRDNIEVKRYFEELNEILFTARYAANFDNQAHECYFDYGAFGTMALYVGDSGTKLMYRSCPMWQCFFEEDQNGVVNVMSREYWLTARNAVSEFGAENLPLEITRAARETPEMEFPFLQVVQPRTDRDVTRRDYRGMAYVSYEISLNSTKIVKEEGYQTFPYAVSRYSVTPGEVYGRGPAELVLPDVRMLNEMNKTTMQAAQLAALPPILANGDAVMNAIRLTPGAINYGGVDANGRPTAQPLQTGGDVGLGLEMMDQKRRIIQDAFWNTLFQILVDTPSMTATEAMLRAQEKGALLAPTASRIETEFLARIVERELDILSRAGVLPEIPQVLLDAGGGYEIDYESPMAQARKAEQGIGILRTIEQLTPLAQALGDQGAQVFRRFKPDEIALTLADVNGMPSKCLMTDEELAELDEEQAQQAELQQILQAAPVAASAAKDLAGAASLAASAPGQVAPALF